MSPPFKDRTGESKVIEHQVNVVQSNSIPKAGDTPYMHLLFLSSLVLLSLSAVNTDHFPPWTAFHSEAPAFASSALLLVAVAVAGRVRLTAGVILLVALLVSVWLQWSIGVVNFAGDAWVVTAYLLAFAAAWLWGVQSHDRHIYMEVLTKLGWTLIAMALFTSFVVLAQWLRVESYWADWMNYGGLTRRSIGNLGQPNLTGTLLLMGVAATGVSVIRGGMSRWVGWLLVLVFGWCVVLTQSRTALLSTTAMVSLLWLAAWKRNELKKFRVDSVVFLVYVLMGSWLLQQVEWDVGKTGIGQSEMLSAGLRPLLWEQLLRGLLQSPWLGYGWLQTAAAQQAGAIHLSGLEQASFAHNAILDLLIWVGLPAGIAALILTANWAWSRLQRLDLGDPAAAGLFLIVPLLVHMQLELPHTYAFFLVPAGIVLGAFDSATTSAPNHGLQIARSFVGVLAVAAVTLYAALLYDYMIAEEDFRVNRFENRRLGVTPSEYEYPELTLLTQLDTMLKAMRLRAEPGMLEADLNTLARTSRRYTWAPMLYRTALAHALNHRPAEAEHHLRLIKHMFRADIYAEGRQAWLDMQQTRYPQLAQVVLP